MSRRGAEGDEMDFLTRPTPEDADLAEFARSLRATLVTAPPEAQEADLVPRLAEEARIAHGQGATEAQRARPARGFRLKRVAQLALGFCLVPLAAAGLATAGVKLPGPAQSAFESVGIELPNQDASEADTPPATSDPGAPAGGTPGAAPASKPGKAQPKTNNGKAKGKSKSKGNGKGQGQAQAPGQSGSAGSNGNGNSGSASPGNSGSAPGQGKSSSSGGSGGSGAAPATPPGQANKPASPGNSGSAPGQNK